MPAPGKHRKKVLWSHDKYLLAYLRALFYPRAILCSRYTETTRKKSKNQKIKKSSVSPRFIPPPQFYPPRYFFFSSSSVAVSDLSLRSPSLLCFVSQENGQIPMARKDVDRKWFTLINNHLPKAMETKQFHNHLDQSPVRFLCI